MTPHEKTFRQLCRDLLRRGIKPTPTILNIYLGRYVPVHPEHRGFIPPVSKRNRPNSLNGRETKWRREELIAAGWLEPGSPYHTKTDKHWMAP